MPIPTTFGVSSKNFLNANRELTTGTPSTTTAVTTIPLDKNDYSPEDTPHFLPDEAIRGVMAQLYNDIIGVEDATFSFGGPAFLDNEGIWLDNTFGDLSSVSNGTLGTPQPLSAPITVGATSLTVGVSLGSVTTGSIIAITDGPASEIVIATSGSTGTVVNFTNTPTRFAHTTSATAALQTVATNYTHTFSLLNSGTGQPPTHTLTDFTGLTTTVGARAYPSACVSQLDFTGNVEQLLMSKVSGNSWLSAPAASAPAANTSFVTPLANWQSTVTLAGAQNFGISEWNWSAKRVLQVYWTAQNSQTPYIIARGGLGVTIGLNFAVPQDETPLTEMLSSGPISVAITITNGLAGANLLSMTLTTTRTQTVKSKPSRNAVIVAYDNQLEALANTTDVGGSAGLSPAKVALTNSVATY